MKIEKQHAEKLESNGYLKDIERAARVCYCSESKGNTEEFVNKLIVNGHYRPLEFGTLYLTLPYTEKFIKFIDDISHNRYSKVEMYNGIAYITTNYRVIAEMQEHWVIEASRMYNIANNISGKTEYHNDRKTVKWTISRGIADEFRTHTMISSLMQSTGYCNYSKDKFDNQITFIRPSWFDDNKNRWKRIVMKTAWWFSEKFYLLLIKMGCKAQEARDVLPLGIKTELIQSAFESDWESFVQQRSSNAAHPDARHIVASL